MNGPQTKDHHISDSQTNSPLKRLQAQLTTSRDVRRANNDSPPHLHGPPLNDQRDDYGPEDASTYLYESSEWSEFDLAKRDSMVSVKSTGRLLDKLGLDDDDFVSGKYSQTERRRSKPLSRGISLLLRVPMDPKVQIPFQIGLQNTPKPVRQPSVKDVQLKAILNKNRSVDSFVADVQTNPDADFSFHRGPSETSLASQSSQKSKRLEPAVKNVQRKAVFNNNNRSHDSFVANMGDNQTIGPEKEPVTPKQNHIQAFSSPYSTSSPHNRSISESAPRNSPSTPTRRIISDSGIVNTSPSNRDLDPETRTATALQLRAMGRHREGLYQLQIAASSPFFYPRAMYLYAIALHLGQGVKQNDSGAAKWLCKLILLTGQTEVSESVVAQYNEQPVEALVALVVSLVKRDPPTDPSALHRYFSELPSHKLSKMGTKDSITASYHELGTFLIHGCGVKKDESTGMLLLAKAGSMGHVLSMVELGELWSVKTKYHRKDYHQAAAWFRLGELFGHKSIGNSWIYKDKYM